MPVRMVSTTEDRGALNSRTPISALNQDILCHIFMLNASVNFVHIHVPSRTTRHTSQVCQRWRGVLLNYPLVWAASLDLADTKAWIEVVLARAGNAPLDLALPSVSRASLVIGQNSLSKGPVRIRDLHRWYIGSPSDDDLEFALSLLPRSRKITISVRAKHQSELVAKKFALFASPNLQEVSLYTMTQSSSNEVYFWKDSDIQVTQGLNLPHIKVLDLIGFWTNFSSPLFQGLTRLHVAKTQDGGALNASAWLRVLGQMPQLRELVLHHCFPLWMLANDNTPHENPTCPIVLSYLQILWLEGVSTFCHGILSRLEFPASCALTICYTIDRRVDLQSYPAMISGLCTKVRALMDLRKVTGLSLHQADHGFIVTNTRHELDDDNAFTIELDMDRRNANILLQLMTDFFRVIFRDVDELCYQFLGFVESLDVVMTALEPFRQVKTLRLKYDECLRVIALINQQDRLVSNPTIFPQLSRICLETTYFGKDPTDVPVQEIIDLIRHRSEGNTPIKHILLKDCCGIEKEKLLTKLGSMKVDVEVELV